ncbi:hypothetical protein [Nonomuraea sp. NPDC049309]|uniref:hypothetical protein n=1 Tax=Nonomuraea sp. NPDC049309 TaxID=3364350 RepID=UPI0037185883
MSGERPKFELSLPQILGSALAAVTAAVAASYLGVAGTVIGAAVVSVSSTVGTAVYTHYLKRTGERVKQRTLAAREDPAKEDPAREDKEDGEDGERTDADERRARRRPPWVKAGAAAAVVFGVSMGSILIYQALTDQTVHEQITGKKPAQAQQARQELRHERRPRETGFAPPAYVSTRTPEHTPSPEPSATPTPDATKQPSTKPSARPTPRPEPSRSESGSDSGAVHPSEAPSTPSRDGGPPLEAEEPQAPAAPSAPQGQEDEAAGQDRAQPPS